MLAETTKLAATVDIATKFPLVIFVRSLMTTTMHADAELPAAPLFDVSPCAAYR